MSELSKKLSDLYKQYGSCKDVEKAIDLAHQILDINPNDYGIKLELMFIEKGVENYKDCLPELEQLYKEYIDYLKVNDPSFKEKYAKNKVDIETYITLYKIEFNLLSLYLELNDFEKAEKEACWLLNNDYSDQLGIKDYLAGIYYCLDKKDKLNQLINAYKGKSLVIDFYDLYTNLFLNDKANEFYINLFRINPYFTMILYGFTKDEDFSAYDMNDIRKGNMQEALDSFDKILKCLNDSKRQELISSIVDANRTLKPFDLFSRFELLFMLVLGGLADINHVTSIKKDEIVSYFVTGLMSQQMKEFKLPEMDKLFSEDQVNAGLANLANIGIFFFKDGYINLTRQGHYLCRSITTIIALSKN